MIWRQLVSSVLFQVTGWLLVRSDDRSNNKWRDTERGSETPSLDGVFRDPPWFALFSAMPTGNCFNKPLGALSNLRQSRWKSKWSKRINDLMCPCAYSLWACVCQWAVMHGCMSVWGKKNPLLKISVRCHKNNKLLPMIMCEHVLKL